MINPVNEAALIAAGALLLNMRDYGRDPSDHPADRQGMISAIVITILGNAGLESSDRVQQALAQALAQAQALYDMQFWADS